jgi:hypothetical protein
MSYSDEFKFKALYYTRAHGFRKTSIEFLIDYDVLPEWNTKFKIVKGCLWTTPTIPSDSKLIVVATEKKVVKRTLTKRKKKTEISSAVSSLVNDIGLSVFSI